MTLDELPRWAVELVEAGRVGRLAYLDGDGRPRALPVTYALADGAVWSAIDDVKPKSGREPARLRYLRERPEAALCVDVYSDDWSRLAWVQLLGSVALVDVGSGAAALEALAAKYPPYREHPPPGPLLRLDTRRTLCWRAADGWDRP